jgi:fermentation-respiration switch protein FrsA (DUF1100 family)
MQSQKGVGFRSLRAALTVLVALGAAAVMFPSSLERMFVYFPIRQLPEDPSSAGLAFEDVSLLTEDQVRLHGWWVPRPDASVTLLVFHGNAGNIGHRVAWIEMLHRAGANVFIIDYRGYGRSEGAPFEQGLYRDARAAYRWWKARPGAGNEKLVLVGESLGGAVATELAASEPVAGVILQSTFTSAWDMAKTMLPLGLLQPLARIRFDSASLLSHPSFCSSGAPKLIIHGTRDEIVPLRMGRRLFDLAPEPKELYEVDGAGHNDLPWVAGPEYGARVARFLKALPPGTPR